MADHFREMQAGLEAINKEFVLTFNFSSLLRTTKLLTTTYRFFKPDLFHFVRRMPI